MADVLQSPFPYAGGKASIAPLVWERLGNVPNFVEAFLGSAAMLLARPHEPGIETVNDADGFICNLWRALKYAPDEVAFYADAPVFESDVHAKHAWLVTEGRERVARLEGDPEWFDAKVAGWWVFGMSVWIGTGFCSGEGPWHVEDGRLVKSASDGKGGVLSSDSVSKGITRKLPHLKGSRGITRQLPHLRTEGMGVARASCDDLRGYFRALSDRLRRVRVCCGDWERVCGFSPTTALGLTGVFLDPPYSDGDRATVYRMESFDVAKRVETWCRERGNDPLLRVALCGYEGNYDLPGWECVPWKANGGYGNQSNGRGRENAGRERLWFSPHCLQPAQERLF